MHQSPILSKFSVLAGVRGRHGGSSGQGLRHMSSRLQGLLNLAGLQYTNGASGAAQGQPTGEAPRGSGAVRQGGRRRTPSVRLAGSPGGGAEEDLAHEEYEPAPSPSPKPKRCAQLRYPLRALPSYALLFCVILFRATPFCSAPFELPPIEGSSERLCHCRARSELRRVTNDQPLNQGRQLARPEQRSVPQ